MARSVGPWNPSNSLAPVSARPFATASTVIDRLRWAGVPVAAPNFSRNRPFPRLCPNRNI